MSQDTAEASLSAERRSRMQEARESIIDRLARDLPTNIDLERFLNVVVSEIGRMLNADRCDLLQLSDGKELRISHEWRKDKSVPKSEGTTIPFNAERLGERFDITKPIRMNDTSLAKDPTLKFFTKALETRSLLIIPIILNGRVLGLLGLHDTHSPRVWLDDEVTFLQSIAQQLAIGYQYTSLYVTQEQESKRTNALLEIANTLNSHSDFKEVSALVLERAIGLVGADYGALGVLDQTGKRISLASFKSAEGIKVTRLLKMIEQHNKSLAIDSFSALGDLLSDRKTLRLVDSQLPFAIRLFFNTQLRGKTALVTQVNVAGQAYGLLGFVWSRENPFEDHDIALIEGIADQIGTALERDQLSAEVMRLKSELHQKQSEIVGQAPSIRRAIELGLNVADTNTTVLILGESGTGKELIANLIHFNSGRESGPYIKLNCGAIPETLIESELFGHEKGAFTDARSQRQGRFEEANGGTLFLDEIGEMPPQAQVKLLRVLQDGEFTRIGGKQVIKSDVRVIAATNSDLETAIDEGHFRKDLFYRLSVFPISLPPLRERPEDVHLLIFHFLELYKEKSGRFVSGISNEAMRALVSYEWPGNVRELENAIERAVIIASGRQIELADLPDAIGRRVSEAHAYARQERAAASGEGRAISLDISLPSALDEIEKQVIRATLDYTAGDKSRAARLLNIGRKTLYRKIDEYNIAD
ncbi:MAG TPA: sigma 54-interacting transcriptional regulator [Pyrinomonadaceae bacterium]|nr:sigma 54-interacting transcriptional regulator [Chloracidobacterium sp.]MBL0241834.1 sigma 54-interacting transcriptional regulator [Chloracidobacterium sp.]MBP9934279.1 sigma 54-interacting transcriptional regulator [Pyrinomonadaceae bacterium]HQX54469.1 sigma 54-interacting transcriptional regulator [Pyrinomonadaceae bacterium]HQY65906.1 sigma 54-interacting transcriptional regulator [Pyrinomonadaceae bacterium]